MELDGRGQSSGGNNGGRGGREADSAGERLNRARGVAVKMDGKVDRVLGGSGREVRRRDGEAWPEQRTAVRLGYSAACEEGEREKENGHGSRGDKDDARARQARFADVRRVASPVLLPSARAYGVESTVNELNSFEMILSKV